MQQGHEFSIVDVFAESPRAGNQLAVVDNAGSFSKAEMQSITREFNFSESTFVTKRSEDCARVRIFTPLEELPFAGHPTLGTAWVLTGGTGAITLELGVGEVPVEFESSVAWMTPPAPEFTAEIPPDNAAAAIGLTTEELNPRFPAVAVRCGPLFRLICVQDPGTLRRARMPAPENATTDDAVFCWCPGGYSEDADFAARMFFYDGSAVREDPATGSANTALATYLRDRGHTGNIIVEQGFEIARPSRIFAELAAQLRIGGRVRAFARGVLAE